MQNFAWPASATSHPRSVPLVVPGNGDVHAVRRRVCAPQGRVGGLTEEPPREAGAERGPGVSAPGGAWTWSVRVPEERRRSRGGSRSSSKLQPGSGSGVSVPGPHDGHRQGFQWQQWHKLPAEASRRLCSDLWCRRHDSPLGRCAVALGSPGWCRQVGSCCKDLEDPLLLHLQNVEGSGHCANFLLSYVGTENNAIWVPLCVVRKGFLLLFFG